MILLDTNVISAAMAPGPPERVVAWLDRQPADQLFLSSITTAEILYGIKVLPEGKRRQGLLKRFHGFMERCFELRTLDLDTPAAHELADIMAHRERIRRPMRVADGQIAAIARCHCLVLATRNLRDFESCGLNLIDPYQP
jgi:predicted nucleic acid-binding protein